MSLVVSCFHINLYICSAMLSHYSQNKHTHTHTQREEEREREREERDQKVLSLFAVAAKEKHEFKKIPSISIFPHPISAQQESLVAYSKQQAIGTEFQSRPHGYCRPPWALKHSHIPSLLGQPSV